MDERLYQIVETNFRLQSMARRELAGTLRAHMVRTEDFMLAASEQMQRTQEQMQRTTETLRRTREAVAEARHDLTAKLEAEADRLDEAVEALHIMASSHAEHRQTDAELIDRVESLEVRVDRLEEAS